MRLHVTRSPISAWLLALVVAVVPWPAAADVITDWNEKALPVMAAYSLGAPAYRDLAMINLAMYQCVNAIEPLSQPYKGKFEAPPDASKEAAASVAAATVLSKLHPADAAKLEAMLKDYLAQIPDGQPKSDGMALGLRVADGVLTMRANDGADAPDAYRPRTTPGRYVATTPVVAPQWATITPFVLTSMAQFRPGPPVALKSQQWADNYNEVKQFGKSSTVRTAAQTETGRFWLYTGPGTFVPITVQLSKAKGLSVAENARLFALLSMATHDAIGAVLDAKYHYEFWRPVTAIRNGDIDANPKTERDAAWEPLGPTPMHPEYPCAHCIVAHAAGTVMQEFFGTGTLPEFTLTTPTAPGVIHRWTRIEDYMQEPSNARIWAGIHYRFSTVVGADMGRKIAAYTLQNTLRPTK
jgi:hypothetical protein